MSGLGMPRYSAAARSELTERDVRGMIAGLDMLPAGRKNRHVGSDPFPPHFLHMRCSEFLESIGFWTLGSQVGFT